MSDQHHPFSFGLHRSPSSPGVKGDGEAKRVGSLNVVVTADTSQIDAALERIQQGMTALTLRGMIGDEVAAQLEKHPPETFARFVARIALTIANVLTLIGSLYAFTGGDRVFGFVWLAGFGLAFLAAIQFTPPKRTRCPHCLHLLDQPPARRQPPPSISRRSRKEPPADAGRE